jgi:hypothetical protein
VRSCSDGEPRKLGIVIGYFDFESQAQHID